MNVCKMPKQENEHEAFLEEELLLRAVLKLNGKFLGIALGLAFALCIFVATNWLVLKGGDVVGPHLGLLGQFFFGYSVTFIGSFIGAAYGLLIGFASGWSIALLYNWIASMRQGITR